MAKSLCKPILASAGKQVKPHQLQLSDKTKSEEFLEIFKTYPSDIISREFLDKNGEIKRRKETQLKQLILQTFLALKEEQPPKNESEEFMLGAKAVELANNKLNEIIEVRFPEDMDYILLDMIEYFLDPKEVITNMNMGPGELQGRKFNKAKVERYYYNLHPGKKLSITGTRKCRKKQKKEGLEEVSSGN
jgi:hypothetical protein